MIYSYLHRPSLSGERDLLSFFLMQRVKLAFAANAPALSCDAVNGLARCGQEATRKTTALIQNSERYGANSSIVLRRPAHSHDGDVTSRSLSAGSRTKHYEWPHVSEH